MKLLLLSTFLFTGLIAVAQPTKSDWTKATSSPERAALLEVLKTALQPDLKLKPKMVVSQLWAKNGFAFFKGRSKDVNGQDIDFSKTVFKEAAKEGMFDGDATVALLKKTGGKWKVLAYAIGPTDLPYVCWWKEHKAPKDIFDFTEECQ